jgi:hypothetical protein
MKDDNNLQCNYSFFPAFFRDIDVIVSKITTTPKNIESKGQVDMILLVEKIFKRHPTLSNNEKSKIEINFL